jgi:1,4-dihydroxy-2-naphthoyl-CoA hydrolase
MEGAAAHQLMILGKHMVEVRPRRNMPEHFGIRIVSAEKDKVVAELDADERHLNNLGIVHGGAYMAFADDVGGTTAGLNKPADMSTTTVESKSNFFRATPPGRLTAICVPLHVGRRTIVVQTSIYGSDGKLAALVTQTQLVIPRTPIGAPRE